MIKKFKDQISFITYVTAEEQYGPLDISFSHEEYVGMVLTITPNNTNKVIPKNIYDKLYDIIWYNFYDNFDLLGYSADNIYHSQFTLQNNKGDLDMTSSAFSGSHEYETNEMVEEIKSILFDIVKVDYFLVLDISGKYDDPSKIEIQTYYLGQFNEENEDADIPDQNGNLKTRIIESILKWTKNYSYKCSSGEYDFDEFSLDFSVGLYENTDTWCHFYEESIGALVDLSVLEINPEEIEIEV